jgi:hypothetical protein
LNAAPRLIFYNISLSGLVVAVMDHEHFRLKLLYKQKKEVTNDLKKSKAEAKALLGLTLRETMFE